MNTETKPSALSLRIAEEICHSEHNRSFGNITDGKTIDVARAIDRHIEPMREALKQMLEAFDSDTARRAYGHLGPDSWTMLEIGACSDARKALQ